MKIKRIAIVGGGSAGWLAANHLGVALHADPDIEITLIESEDVPIIGVGEGTVPLIRESLQKFGIAEIDLIADCDTTFKHGIKFVDWLNPQHHGKGNFYYHPFSPAFPDGYNISPYMLASGQRFSDVGPGMAACEAMRCPKKISSPPYQGELGYAYHVNAHKFAQLLAKNAKQRFAVRHQMATIVSATRNADGSIGGLVLKSGDTIAFDFYVDCSGFASILSGGALQVPFVDKSHQLLTDSAMVQQVPTEEHDAIAPYTKATAHAAGWIWDIPVTNRRGTGFVYSSAHMSEDAAAASFASYLGISASAFAPRKIPMKIGYRKHFWVKNCIALGLAQGFVEPLEATSIFLTDISAQLFANNFPRLSEDIDVLSNHCNEVVGYWWERTIDFIQLHYHLSDRDDTAFWLDNANSTTLSPILQDRLARWRLAAPKRTDFFSNFDLFDATSYSFILYGMQYGTRQALLADDERHDSMAQLALVRQRSEQLMAELPPHREWLTKLSAAMKQMGR